MSGVPDYAKWKLSGHENAECLYLILESIQVETGEGSAFSPSEVGDVDNDNMFEILDAWGNPISFLRWAPGFSESRGPDGQWGVAGVDDDGDGIIDNSSEAGWPGSDDGPSPSPRQSRNGLANPDPFDPLKADSRFACIATPSAFRLNPSFRLYPLVFSAGPDGIYDINVGTLNYSTTTPPNDPFYSIASGNPIGQQMDTNGDGTISYADNLHNHLIEVK